MWIYKAHSVSKQAESNEKVVKKLNKGTNFIWQSKHQRVGHMLRLEEQWTATASRKLLEEELRKKKPRRRRRKRWWWWGGGRRWWFSDLLAKMKAMSPQRQPQHQKTTQERTMWTTKLWTGRGGATTTVGAGLTTICWGCCGCGGG